MKSVNCKMCGKPLQRIRIKKVGAICMSCNLRRWKLNNPDKMPSYHAKEYAEKRDQVIARLDRWRKNNPEKWNAIQKADSHNRRVATKYNGKKIPTVELMKLLEDAKGLCFYCREEHNGNFNFDHYIPLSKGGRHEIPNLRIACVSCNKHKAAKLPNIVVLYKPSLIDSKPRQGNEAEAERHRDRLSERARTKRDAIVGTCDINKTQEVSRND